MLPSAGGGVSPDADLLSGATHTCNPPQVDTEGNGAAWETVKCEETRATHGSSDCVETRKGAREHDRGDLSTWGLPHHSNLMWETHRVETMSFLMHCVLGLDPWEGLEWGPLELLVCPLSTFYPSSSTVLQSRC